MRSVRHENENNNVDLTWRYNPPLSERAHAGPEPEDLRQFVREALRGKDDRTLVEINPPEFHGPLVSARSPGLDAFLDKRRMVLFGIGRRHCTVSQVRESKDVEYRIRSDRISLWAPHHTVGVYSSPE